MLACHQVWIVIRTAWLLPALENRRKFTTNIANGDKVEDLVQKLLHGAGVPLLKIKKLSEMLFCRPEPSLSPQATTSPARWKRRFLLEEKHLFPLILALPSQKEPTHALLLIRGWHGKHSIDVGAIDVDYRVPIGVILFNHSDIDFEVKIGDRVAQMIIERIITPDVSEVEDLDETVRGADGFGSTGV